MTSPLTSSPSPIRCVSVVIPVYRDSARAVGLVRALEQQQLPPNIGIEIIVVDDGSGDGSASQLEAALGSNIVLQQLPSNSGRAVARNAGAMRASGEALLFMDSDCLPTDKNLISAHLQSLTSGVVASLGTVTGNGNGFWHHYQAKASERRARQHASGIYFSGSSQNMLVLRSAFETCGGFDNMYRTYGFEDRDLQLRIGQSGRIVWTAAASVRHMDVLTLPTVCRKMFEAGGHAAMLFSQRYPAAYRALGYAALDTRLHRHLKIPAQLLAHMIPSIARWSDKLIASPKLPYAFKSRLVKAMAGFSYLAGTLTTNSSS